MQMKLVRSFVRSLIDDDLIQGQWLKNGDLDSAIIYAERAQVNSKVQV